MAYDDGSPPDDLANAAGEISTEIGVGPDENGDGTSADAHASPFAETARVQIAYPTPHLRFARAVAAVATTLTSHAETSSPLQSRRVVDMSTDKWFFLTPPLLPTKLLAAPSPADNALGCKGATSLAPALARMVHIKTLILNGSYL